MRWVKFSQFIIFASVPSLNKFSYSRCSAAEKYSLLSEDEAHFQSPMISEENFGDMFNIGNVLGKGPRATVSRYVTVANTCEVSNMLILTK